MELRDGELYASLNPDTFEIPPLLKRLNLKAGDLVKLGFLLEPMPERMWVQITEVWSDGYVGRLRNQSVSDEMAFDELVTFEPRHVLDIVKPPLSAGP
jgi:hypothetical protein